MLYIHQSLHYCTSWMILTLLTHTLNATVYKNTVRHTSQLIPAIHVQPTGLEEVLHNLRILYRLFLVNMLLNP